MALTCSYTAARLPCCRETEQTMTINQAFEVVEAKLNAAHIHSVNRPSGGTFPLNSQYFGRYGSDVLQHYSPEPKEGGCGASGSRLWRVLGWPGGWGKQKLLVGLL